MTETYRMNKAIKNCKFLQLIDGLDNVLPHCKSAFSQSLHQNNKK